VEWESVSDWADAKKVKALERSFKEFLTTRTLSLYINRSLALVSAPGEDLNAFRERCRRAAREEETRALKDEKEMYSKKFAKLGAKCPEDQGLLDWLVYGSAEQHLTTPKQKAEFRKLKTEWEKKQKEIPKKWKGIGEECSDFPLTPKKSALEITVFGLAWVPFWRVSTLGGKVEDVQAHQ
jgi:hypothetical protein